MKRSTTAGTLANRLGLALMFLSLALPASLLVATLPAQATNYIVSNTDDSGPGSLRQAINDAKNHPGPDTITFAAVTDGKAIVLAGAAYEDANANGDLDILDADDLTIQGNGRTKTIVDGGGTDRVFHICPGGGCTSTVTLTGLTIRNGNTGGAGGIYNQAKLIVQDSLIGGAGGGNVAYNGGGIYSSAGTSTTLDGSTVSANGASFGGGIYNNGTLNITNSVIGGAGVGNAATNDGGGIYHVSGTLTVDGSTISANTAKNGGGIYSEAPLEVLNGSTIGEPGAANQATDAGGGICSLLAGSTTTVDDSSVNANEAQYCAGIFSQGTLKIQNGSSIGAAGAGNEATAFGGGICNQAGTTTVDDSSVIGNHAAEQGGAILNYAGGTTTVTGSRISSNSAADGGGIYSWDNCTTTVDASTIGGIGEGNVATDNGGGLYNNAGTMIVTGSRILHNTAASSGGGVYSDHNFFGATNVSGSCIVGNSDASFHNKWAAQQIAAGNWWGAPTGPNTPGADTVSDDVLYSGFLAAPPIPGCAYDVFLPVVLR
jgi:hypothetical protein